jgi:hypothetical protein
MKRPLPSFVDSPLAEAVLEPMTAKLLQEELQIRGISAADLARKLCAPRPLLEEAIKGACALKVGMWKAIVAALKLKAEHYQFRAKERDGGECWELYHIFVVPTETKE